MKTALTIAGSDSSGGAGIQADLKAMTMNGVFAMSAVTALTAQNTTGVSGIFEVSPEFLAQQIDAVFTDIRPCAVKIGMVSSAPLIETIAERLRFYKAEHIVVDPVMVATSGSDLIASDAVRTLRRELFPLAEVITPNRHEAEVLSGLHISGRADMSAAARAIAADCGCAVLLKGGHSDTDADDLLTFPDGTEIWFPGNDKFDGFFKRNGHRIECLRQRYVFTVMAYVRSKASCTYAYFFILVFANDTRKFKQVQCFLKSDRFH